MSSTKFRATQLRITATTAITAGDIINIPNEHSDTNQNVGYGFFTNNLIRTGRLQLLDTPVTTLTNDFGVMLNANTQNPKIVAVGTVPANTTHTFTITEYSAMQFATVVGDVSRDVSGGSQSVLIELLDSDNVVLSSVTESLSAATNDVIMHYDVASVPTVFNSIRFDFDTQPTSSVALILTDTTNSGMFLNGTKVGSLPDVDSFSASTQNATIVSGTNATPVTVNGQQALYGIDMTKPNATSWTTGQPLTATFAVTNTTEADEIRLQLGDLSGLRGTAILYINGSRSTDATSTGVYEGAIAITSADSNKVMSIKCNRDANVIVYAETVDQPRTTTVMYPPTTGLTAKAYAYNVVLPATSSLPFQPTATITSNAGIGMVAIYQQRMDQASTLAQDPITNQWTILAGSTMFGNVNDVVERNIVIISQTTGVPTSTISAPAMVPTAVPNLIQASNTSLWFVLTPTADVVTTLPFEQHPIVNPLTTPDGIQYKWYIVPSATVQNLYTSFSTSPHGSAIGGDTSIAIYTTGGALVAMNNDYGSTYFSKLVNKMTDDFYVVGVSGYQTNWPLNNYPCALNHDYAGAIAQTSTDLTAVDFQIYPPRVINLLPTDSGSIRGAVNYDQYTLSCVDGTHSFDSSFKCRIVNVDGSTIRLNVPLGDFYSIGINGGLRTFGDKANLSYYELNHQGHWIDVAYDDVYKCFQIVGEGTTVLNVWDAAINVSNGLSTTSIVYTQGIGNTWVLQPFVTNNRISLYGKLSENPTFNTTHLRLFANGYQSYALYEQGDGISRWSSSVYYAQMSITIETTPQQPTPITSSISASLVIDAYPSVRTLLTGSTTVTSSVSAYEHYTITVGGIVTIPYGSQPVIQLTASNDTVPSFNVVQCNMRFTEYDAKTVTNDNIVSVYGIAA